MLLLFRRRQQCTCGGWRALLLLGLELLSSPGISPERRGTGLLLGPGSLAPGGVQGEGEGRTVGSKKPNGKKLTERGGTPPLTDFFRDWGF